MQRTYSLTYSRQEEIVSGCLGIIRGLFFWGRCPSSLQFFREIQGFVEIAVEDDLPLLENDAAVA